MFFKSHPLVTMAFASGMTMGSMGTGAFRFIESSTKPSAALETSQEVVKPAEATPATVPVKADVVPTTVDPQNEDLDTIIEAEEVLDITSIDASESEILTTVQ